MHKGLKLFYQSGKTKGINAEHAQRLQGILSIMDVATSVAALDLPQYRLHELQGKFEVIDYEQYH